jgi:flavin reductase (DIM6/NTAB) family NADH-FMN oxidoreductase RutF
MECVVRNKILLGSHQLFLGEVVLVHADESVLDEKGEINNRKFTPIVYNRREYWSLRGKIGVHGFSKKASHPAR